MFVRTEVPKEEGCFDPQNKLWWDRATNRPVVTHSDGRRPVPARRVQAVRRHAGQARVPAAEGARRRLHAGMGGAASPAFPPTTIRRLAHEMGVTARDQKIELPIRLDRLVGQGARDRHRQSGRVPRDARPRRALERLPDDPRARDPDVAARHDRPARRLPPQGAVPARRSRRARRRRTRRARSSRTRRSTACALGWPAEPGRPVRRRRRRAGAHRQGVLVGVPARRARADAQRHHQRVARRSVPDRHADDLHGQHGVELDDEHGRGAPDAERQATRTASTRFRSSSSATRSSRR